MNITVYLGAREGNEPVFRETAAEVGKWIAEAGHRLIYGGSGIRLMGVLADAAMESGGEVIGVTPDFFITAEEIHNGLTELRISADLPERRKIMIEEGDAFLALPGGTGTLDEITEVMSLRRLGLLGDRIRPIMLYNVNGYYDHFFRFLDRVADEEFFSRKDREFIHDVRSIEDIERVLASAGIEDMHRNILYSK